MKIGWLLVCGIFLAPARASGQDEPACRFLCAPEFKVEPTVAVSNLIRPARVIGDDGAASKQERDAAFELVVSTGIPTRFAWLDFTVEVIVAPFDPESTPELELETNFTWLDAARTGGWIGSHVDIVDKFSPAERPTDRRAYTHKLNVELDTSLALFNWLPEGWWLRGVEIEGSLDYVATGLPKRGDVVDDIRFLDDASPWSFSVVLVLPVAPF